MAARAVMSSSRALAGIIVPIYLALIGYTGAELGLLFSVVALTSAGLSSSVGFLSDRIGRKPFLVVLPLFAAAAGVVFAFTRAPAAIFAFAALGSFGRGAGAGAGAIGPYQPAEQAYLADAIPVEARNTLFGRLGFMSSLGGLVGGGPLAALPALIGATHFLGLRGVATYRPVYLVIAALALAAGLLALPVSEDRSRAPAAKRSPRRRRPGLHLSRASWSVLVRLWMTNSVNGLAVGFFGPFITYWFYRRYGAGPALVGALYSVINLAAMASVLSAAPIAHRLGLVRTVVITRALQALLMIPMVLAPSFWVAGGFYLLRMVVQRIGLPLRQSYVMAVVAPEERGTVGAFANLPSQATSALSPIPAGWLFDNVSLSLPFEIGAFLQGVNTILYYAFFHRRPPPEERAAPPTGPSGILPEAADEGEPEGAAARDDHGA